MIYINRIILFFAFLITVSSFAQEGIDLQDEIIKSEKDTLTFIVYGMDCPGCEGGLEKQVNKIPAVESSKANWVDQKLTVVVRSDSTLNMNELKNRVEQANFTLDMKEIVE